MKKNILKEIKKAASVDARKRKDLRYLATLAFLVKNGFLKTNQDVLKFYRPRISVSDAIWAGENVEPRILEVLPAAILRLKRRFIIETDVLELIHGAVAALQEAGTTGIDFFNIPFKKYSQWMNLPLTDRRTKTISQKKVMKSFRLSPAAIKSLQKLSAQLDLSSTETLEKILMNKN